MIIPARYEDANDVYDAILRKDETNTVVRKRKIAILKSLGKTSEAIRELVDYLKKYEFILGLVAVWSFSVVCWDIGK